MDINKLDYTKSDKFPQVKAWLKSQSRLDALSDGSDAFYDRVAAQILLNMAKVQVLKTPMPKAAQLVPTLTESVDADSILLATGEEVGEAKVIANPADDLPRVDIAVEPRAVRVHNIGDSYGLSIINQQNGWGVQRGDKADAARKAIDRKIANIALWGDAAYGLEGLYTTKYALTETTNITTGNELSAITKAINVFEAASDYAYEPTHIIVPQVLYERLTETFKGNNETMPLIQSLKQIRPNVEIVPNADKRAFGKSKDEKSGRIVVGAFDVGNFRNRVPRGFTQLPDQMRNLEIVVNCYARCAGLEVMDKRALMHVDYTLA